MWTPIAKPTSSLWTTTNPQGKEQYDQSNIAYDDANTFYDGINALQWTGVTKPSVLAWTKIAKPT